MTTYLPLDPLTLELGYALVPLAMESEGGDLLTRITNLRRQVALEMGIIVPPIRVKDDLTLTPNQYTLKLRGVGIALGEVLPHFFLAMNAGRATGPIEGAATTDPAFGLPAYWVSVNERDKAERAGYAIIDAPSVLITHLAEALKDHAHEILTRQEVRLLLDRVHETNPTIVDELIPELLSRGQVQRVLQNLVQERVPIRDLVSILEALADGVALTHDLDELTELARQRLARVICEALASQDRLPAVVLDPSLERLLAESIQPTSRGRVVVLNAERMQRFAENLSAQMEAVAGLGYQPVLVCTSQVRLPLRRLLARLLPRLVVLSYEEADRGQVQVNALGMVRLES
jgi:flagellar biosynthesis protein FlhA